MVVCKCRKLLHLKAENSNGKNNPWALQHGRKHAGRSSGEMRPSLPDFATSSKVQFVSNTCTGAYATMICI